MNWIIPTLLAALLSGISVIFIKKLLLHEHSLDFSVVLGLLLVIMSLPFIPFISRDVTLWQYGLIFLEALCASFGFWYVTKSIKRMEVSEVTAFLALGPLFTFILALIFLKETLTPWQIGGITLIAFGGYVLHVDHKTKSPLEPIKKFLHFKYFKYIMGFSLLYALDSIINRYLVNTAGNQALDSATFFFWFHIFVAAIMLVFYFFFKQRNTQGIIHTLTKNSHFLLIIVILTFGYRLAEIIAISLPQGNIAMVIGIKRLGLLVPAIIAGELFHEHHLFKRITAFAIMVIGSLLLL